MSNDYRPDPVLSALADQLAAQTRDCASGLVAIVQTAHSEGEYDTLTVNALVMRRLCETFGEPMVDRSTGLAALVAVMATMLAYEVETR